jgi:hypothetical protein
MKVFLIIYGVLGILGLIAFAHGVATAVEVPQDVEI